MSIFAYFERREDDRLFKTQQPDPMNIKWHGPVLEGQISLRMALRQNELPAPQVPACVQRPIPRAIEW